MKKISLFSLVMINIIAIDSLRSIPLAASLGWQLIGYYALAITVFFVPMAWITAELATRWPVKGGIYYWIEAAFGKKMGLFVVWIQWIYNIIWYPTILLFIVSSLSEWLHPAWTDHTVIMFLFVNLLYLAATSINLYGLRLSSQLSTWAALIGTLLPMAVICCLGVVYALQQHHIAWHVPAMLPDISNTSHWPFWVAIAFSLVGIEMSAVHADEVQSPATAYPRAIVISALLVVSSLVASSLAVTAVVPSTTLNNITGINQALTAYLDYFDLPYLKSLMVLCISLGGIGSVAAWIIGPAKAFYAAAHEGALPPALARLNAHGVPTRILALQSLIFFLLSTVYVFFEQLRDGYMLLTIMTAQLALIVYLLIFCSAWRLRHLESIHPQPSYRIPRSILPILCFLGMFSSVAFLLIGFIPPDFVSNPWQYEAWLIGGMAVFMLLPMLIYWRRS